MVNYMGVNSVRELVQYVGLAEFLEQLVDAMDSDYRRWEQFDKSARHAIHSPVGVIELMPTSDGHLYCFKYVNGHPKNTAEGLLTVTAFGVLADVDTGYPLLVSELTLTTALRTAAMSALAARHLARQDSRIMALIGNGAQSEFQALAFYHLQGIRQLRLYDTDPGASAKLERNLTRRTCRTCRSCVAHRCRGRARQRHRDHDHGGQAQRYHPAAADDRAGHAPQCRRRRLSGQDGTARRHPAPQRRPVVVEYEPQSRIEGEIQQMPADFAVTEFTQVLRGKR